MMGPRQEAQGALFYEFSLEDHVPGDHLLRSIDRFVDLAGIRTHLAPYYSTTGRPSVDPELMIRMLLIGYCMGIRSERRLCDEVHLNLAYRWFCRLDLTDPVPDHSTFSKNRHGRFRDSDLLRHLFESEPCRANGPSDIGERLRAASARALSAARTPMSAVANFQVRRPETDCTFMCVQSARATPRMHRARAGRGMANKLCSMRNGLGSRSPSITTARSPRGSWPPSKER